MEKSLATLLESLEGSYKIFGSATIEGVRVTSVSIDSRKATSGSLFFALPGIHTTGLKFALDAVKCGAVAVVAQSADGSFKDTDDQNFLSTLPQNIPVICVPNIKEALWRVSCAFFDNPSKHLVVVGVTGTEGKSSTVSFLWTFLQKAGVKAGFISTVEYSLGDGALSNSEHQTTPEAPIVQERLAAMVDNGCEVAIVESSSHGLSKKLARLGGVAFDVAIFMNVTEEHLEFHKTFEQYRSDKANLFRALDEVCHKKVIKGVEREIEPLGVVCADDKSADYFVKATKAPCVLFGRNIKGFVTPSPVPGDFNSYNVSAALIAACHITKKSPSEFFPIMSKLTPVLGRMTRVECGQDFTVIVDYAHTPSSFLAVLPSIKKASKGRVIAVFGSGGERDKVKRPVQGQIAAQFCDFVILADEDPRWEDPLAILRDIAKGALSEGKVEGENLFLIPDRPTAIKKAFSLAKARDTVLLLGKGHENSIIQKDIPTPYSEIETAKSILKAILSNKSSHPTATK